jgi:hypothetical protein
MEQKLFTEVIPVYLKAFLQELADTDIVYELQDKQIRSLPAIRVPWKS